MTSDLPDETGSLDPGLDQLFRTLTAGPVPGELAGEHDALAMFRANVRPPASPASARGRFGRSTTGPARSGRGSFRSPAQWVIRLAAATAVVVGGGTAAAAYAAVLPAPVQHLAHTFFRFAGVPDAQHGHAAARRGGPGHHTGSATGHSTPSPGQTSPAPAGSNSASSAPSAPASASPTASSSPSAVTGPWLLSATAVSGEIAAGSEAVIDGQLTRSGAGAQGVTVILLERLAGHLRWQVAGTAQTNADGNVAESVAALVGNALFRLTIPGTAHSATVRITVAPVVTAVLNSGPDGADSLVASTQYAQRGDVAELQAESASGAWVYLRSKTLTAGGQVTFALSGTRLKNQEVRVVLLATVRHGAAASNPVLVPAPG